MQETLVQSPGLGRSPGKGIDYPLQYSWASPGGSAGKESACNTGELASIPGLGRSPGEGKGYPIQCFGLKNSMDCIVHGGRKELDMTEQLSLTYIQKSAQISQQFDESCKLSQSVSPVSSFAQLCPTLCNPMNHSMPGLPVHHQLPEFTQTRVHRVGDAIQPSHPLSSPSSPAPNPSQHQGLFQ